MLGGTLGAATQASPQNLQSNKPSVLVVGAGLIGSSVAMHLAKKGCHVQVLEAAEPASGMSDNAGSSDFTDPEPVLITSCGSAGASGKSWAWLNANRKQPVRYRGVTLALTHLILKQAYGVTWQGCGAVVSLAAIQQLQYRNLFKS